MFENIEILVTNVSGQCQSMVRLWSREARNEERSAILQWIDEIYIHLYGTSSYFQMFYYVNVASSPIVSPGRSFAKTPLLGDLSKSCFN